MAINKATITGNITRDPELRQTQGGTSVLTIGVAVNDRRKNQQTGEWEDYPNFIDCTIFGNRATGVAPRLEKGMKVAIEGKLNQSRWQAEDGTNRSKIEIIVDEIEFMSRQQGQTASKPVRPSAYAATGAAAAVRPSSGTAAYAATAYAAVRPSAYAAAYAGGTSAAGYADDAAAGTAAGGEHL